MTSFDDILAQDSAVSILRGMFAREHLPHGLIFAGPAGVGKATTAQALGALFLCENPCDGKPCGQCVSCRTFAAANHPDYHVIIKELARVYDKTGESKATTMSIDVVREELVKKASLKPAMGRGKVFIVEQADLMNMPAQNAALKTLEEPSGRTLIILLTDQELSLLPTIRSRCQVVRFGPLPDDIVARELQRRGKSASDAADAADFAEGSLGLALRWLDDGVIDRAHDLRHRLDDLLAGKGAGDLADWVRAAADDYAARQLAKDELASKSQMARDGTAIYLALAGQYFRRKLAQTPDERRLDRLCQAIDALTQAEQYLDANVTVALIFQQLAVTLEGLFS